MKSHLSPSTPCWLEETLQEHNFGLQEIDPATMPDIPDSEHASTNWGEGPSCAQLKFPSFYFPQSDAMCQKLNLDTRNFGIGVEDPEVSMFNSYNRVPENHLDDFISKFEALLARFGIEAVIFLRERNRRSCNFEKSVGKVCVIRSHWKRPEEVEFGVR